MKLDTTSFGAELTAITMGIDALERRRSEDGGGLLDGEGLVPIYMGGDLIPARSYQAWKEPLGDLAALEQRVDSLPEERRRVFARSMVTSLRVAVQLFSGGTPSYQEKISDLVGAPIGPVDSAVIDGIRDELDALLRQAGHGRGTMASRIGAWEEARRIDVPLIEGMFSELMAEAKARTDSRIFPTGDYNMALNPVTGVHYTARCDFSHGRMDLNMEIHMSRAQLKHLVCHEVYPGHSTQLLYTRDGVERGTCDAEVLLCTANTVLGCVQEGIGDQGCELIDWIEDADDRIYQLLRNLRTACQTSAAWHLMVDGWPASKVADYLRDVAAGQEAWIRGRLRMAAHPFRGPFIASYWAGNEAVRQVRERVPPHAWPQFIAFLYGEAHSPASLAMFRALAATMKGKA
jgi:hypothetical protein